MEYVRFTAKTLHPFGIDCLEKSALSPLAKGHIAEEKVVSLLVSQAWNVHSRNFRSLGCELDIVASKGKTLSFIEVKYKKKMPMPLTAPSLGLSPKKQRSMQKGALTLFRKNSILFSQFSVWRFDLAVVTHAFDSIHYFSNCFEWVVKD